MSENASTWKLAHLILHEYWDSGGLPVRVSNMLAVGLVGISSDSKDRALRELEAMDLVVVERRKGRAPLVTPLGNLPHKRGGSKP
jgi:hypothetical protein